jgi:hypothetical protein
MRLLPRYLALALAAAALSSFSPARADDPAPRAPVDLQNATCPVKGDPVKPGVTATVDGTVVHFCCTKCAEKYRANPSAYEKALRADPAVSQRIDQAHASAHAVPTSMTAPAEGGKGLEFHDAMRRLWEDHAWWTRLFIVSATSDLADKDATTSRLLKNQEDIGNGIRPFYGDEAATKLTALLKDHITIAADVVAASKSGQSAKADAASKKWTANADEIAAFLAGANPTAWPLEAGKAMMREHLDLTTSEVKARLAKDWEADIAAYERVREQALKMADMLSDGIRRQFPQKFQ